MANSLNALKRQIKSAGDLKSVVRTMKASAASAIGQYDNSVAALADYARTVELGLGLCLRSATSENFVPRPIESIGTTQPIHAVVFGSDQGLVGRFNEVVVEHALSELEHMSQAGDQAVPKVWAVGERVKSRLIDTGVTPKGLFAVPGSVEMITRLVAEILLNVKTTDNQTEDAVHTSRLILFYNRPTEAGYTPVSQKLLPLDTDWQHRLATQPWPTNQLPEVLDSDDKTLGAFIREHLFVSIFRASAESLASENASRLVAMQRADRNIGDLLESLTAQYHQLRQSGIDEELFDLISGFDALSFDKAR